MQEFFVKFWGVRGSIACPGPSTLKYGGNTSCIEVRCGDYNFIFDAGTGLKKLGDSLPPNAPLNYDIFLTHTHFDHLNGFPFFKPAYSAASRLKIWAGHLRPNNRSIEEEIRNLMDRPFFPITVDIMAATLIFNDFEYGETLQISPQITLRTAKLNHPDGATGYRVEFDNRSICYVTDTEHVPGKPDENIINLIRDADLVIYDCNFTDAEFEHYRGWGHSTWQEGVRLCKLANAKKLVVFHHDPSHDDAFMDRVAKEVEQALPGSVVAQENMVIRP
jgi:phosphoribosyl 1,2-cyclic phosphodiesterase